MKKGDMLALNILHKALMAGPILLGVIVFFMVYNNVGGHAKTESDKLFQIVALVLSVAGLFAAVTIFKRKLVEIRSMDSNTGEKFAAYRGACLIQWALLEGPAIFCLIAFFLVGNYSLLALGGVLILIMALLAPSKNKVMIQLGLTQQEADEL